MNKKNWKSNYHFQSKTYESPFLQPNYPMIPFQMQLNVDHIFCYTNPSSAHTEGRDKQLVF